MLASFALQTASTTAGTLAAALVVYLVGAIGGAFKHTSLSVILSIVGVVIGAVALLPAVWWLRTQDVTLSVGGPGVEVRVARTPEEGAEMVRQVFGLPDDAAANPENEDPEAG